MKINIILLYSIALLTFKTNTQADELLTASTRLCEKSRECLFKKAEKEEKLTKEKISELNHMARHECLIFTTNMNKARGTNYSNEAVLCLNSITNIFCEYLDGRTDLIPTEECKKVINIRKAQKTN